MKIKALSMWQPWATLIMLEIKLHETRHWATKYRGDLVIHAAKRPMDARGIALIKQLQEMDCPDVPVIEEIEYGKALGIVNLFDCIKTEELVSVSKYDLLCGNFEHGRFAWAMNNVRPFEQPIPMVGRQTLWNAEIA